MAVKTQIARVTGAAPLSGGKAQLVTVEQVAPLTPSERDDLHRLEGAIAARLNASLELGLALLEIKQRRLYRQEFPTFEEYCRKRWDLSRGHAYRLLGAADLSTKLSPMGDIPLPANERQFRALIGLSPKTAQRAWSLAIERAGTPEKVTASLIKIVVREITKRRRSPAKQGKEFWQTLIEPHFEKAAAQFRNGDRDGFRTTIYQIEDLLMIGNTKLPDGP